MDITLSNKGPQDAEHYLALLRDLKAGSASWDGTAVTEDNASNLRDHIGYLSAVGKQAEKDRKALKEPYLQSGRKVDASFKPVATEVLKQISPLKKMITDFLEQEEREKREAAKRAEEEARAKAALADKVKEDAFVGEVAEEQAVAAAKEAKYASLLAEQNSVKGSEDDRAMSLRTYYRAKVVNGPVLVAYYATHPDVLELCERLANREIRSAKGGMVQIPGIDIVEERKAV